MYDFDVIFLLLSSPPSTRFDEILRLHDFAANLGFHTAVATSPIELAITAKRLRIIVIDGDPDSDFDVHAVTAAMRRLNNVAILLLTEATLMQGEWGQDAGADICLPIGVATEEFGLSVVRLAHDKLYASRRDIRHLASADTSATVSDEKTVSLSTPFSEPAAIPAQASWTLFNNGWVLSSPKKISLRLTATERDLMTYIFTAEDKSVYHGQWDSRYGRVSSDRGSKVSALSLVVGRLRRKWAILNVKLPIYVKRGRGYWFVGDCRIASEPNKSKSASAEELDHSTESYIACFSDKGS